jgi:hypothetical protein
MNLERSIRATLMFCVLASSAVCGDAWSQPGTVLTCQKHNHFTMAALGSPLDDGDEFGDAVAGLGDLDGSGPAVGALAVGAISDDDGGSHRGAVYILFVDDAGGVISYRKITSLEPDLAGTLEEDDEFGGAIAYLGDLDGNGPSVAALAVGAIGDDDGGFDRGAVYVLFLDPAGQVLSHQKISQLEGNFTAPLDDLDEFGGAVGFLGDLDGAGASAGALVVGTIGDDDGGTNRGAAYILFLSPNGMVQSHQKICDTDGDFTAGLGNNDNFGEDVAGLGDLDGAGPSAAALVVTAVDDDDGGSDRGAVYVLFLANTGRVLSYQKISNTQGNFSGPLADKDNFGSAVIGLGDLDGSGPSATAIAVGAASDDGPGLDRGAVYVLFLNQAGMVLSDLEYSSTAGSIGAKLNDEAEFGGSVAVLGDLDGSGPAHQFLVSGVGLDDDGGPDRGGVYVLALGGGGTVDVDQSPAASRAVGVSHVRPNPFRGVALVSFRVETQCRVGIDVLDISGRTVRSLVHEESIPGEHRVAWNGLDDGGRAVAPGIYYLRMSVNGQPLNAGAKAVLVR